MELEDRSFTHSGLKARAQNQVFSAFQKINRIGANLISKRRIIPGQVLWQKGHVSWALPTSIPWPTGPRASPSFFFLSIHLFLLLFIYQKKPASNIKIQQSRKDSFLVCCYLINPEMQHFCSVWPLIFSPTNSASAFSLPLSSLKSLLPFDLLFVLNFHINLLRFLDCLSYMLDKNHPTNLFCT